MRATASMAVLLLGISRTGAPPVLAAPPVTVNDKGDRVTLDNGQVAFDVAKVNGNFAALKYDGLSILAEPGYLDWVGPRNNHIARGAFTVVTNPADNAGEMAEVRVAQKFAGGPSPFDVEIHYVLRRGDSGPYCFVIFSHQSSYPEGGYGQARWVLRLSDDVFDFINVDAQRRFLMPPSNTPTRMLGPKESLMFTDGPFKGQITDKYHFYVDSGDHFFHGWTGTNSHIGCWVISGSNEAQNGGPTKQHNDAQFGRLLFKIITCVHYGAAGIHVNAGQQWQKIYGPWMLYLNHAESNNALWANAQRKSASERAAWPLVWMRNKAYPLADQRGTVSGQLTIHDPQDQTASPSNAWVGLAAPSPDWQQQSDGYQFWVRADPDGRFRIPAIRAGHYTLYAFVDGVMDQFRLDRVDVTPGANIALGALEWRPVRYGQQIWQIGTPDRTAREFRHGDDYRQWGLWQKFPVDFPQGVNFVIGKSRERTDWNYAQMNVQKDGKWVGTTWNILFSQPSPSRAGTAVLRLALASTHNAKLTIRLNDQVIDSFRTAADNAMIRAGIHGQYSEQDTFFDASLIRQGTNTFSLTQSAGGNVQKSIMYDCIRLEVDGSHPFDKSIVASHPHLFPQSSRDAGDADD
jgi:rhamnogalacturonan endolyase